MILHIVEEAELPAHRDHLRLAPRLNSMGHPEWSVIDGFLARAVGDELDIRDGRIWERHRRY